MKTHPSVRIGAGLAALFLLVSMNAFGEGPTNEELQDTIKRLEARLAELEAKVSKDANGAHPIAAKATTPSEPAEKTANAEPSPTDTILVGNGNANGNSFLKGIRLGSHSGRLLRL